MGIFKEMNGLGQTNKALDTRINGQAKIFDNAFNPAATFGDEPTRNNFQTYPYDYFCGTNAKVFFGDIWVDDVVTIQYNLKQDKEPIYGYASQHFDAIARGTIIVQGSFTIAFKEMGYLNVIANALESQLYRSTKSLMLKQIETKLQQAADGTTAFDPRLARLDPQAGYVYSPNGQPEIIRQNQTIEDILMYKKNNGVVSSGLSIDFGLGDNAKERDFEDFAELLEDTIWGDSNGKPYTSPTRNFRRADEFDYEWNGNHDMGGIKMAEKTSDGKANYAKVLNIMITFGDLNDYRAEHTMVVLNDVHIVSSTMVVSPTGEPVGETYFFMARDINQTLSRETIGKMNPVKYNVGLGDEDVIPKESDIKNIEDFIAKQDNPNFEILVKSLSKFKYNTAGIGTWQADNTYNDTFSMTAVNAWDSKLDQIIKVVERNINDIQGEFNLEIENAYTDRNTEYSQWVMNVQIVAGTRTNGPGVGTQPRKKRRKEGYRKDRSKDKESLSSLPDTSPNGATTSFNIILDQRVPNTLTYRVISPSRNNFSSVSMFTRGDLWNNDLPAIGLAKVVSDSTADAAQAAPEESKKMDVPTTPAPQVEAERKLNEPLTEAQKAELAKDNGTGPDGWQTAGDKWIEDNAEYIASEKSRLDAKKSTTAPTKKAIVSGVGSHVEEPWAHPEGAFEYGLELGEKVALDIGNLNSDGTSAGSVPSPFEGRVTAANYDSRTILIETPGGVDLSYSHLEGVNRDGKVIFPIVNDPIKLGENLYYGQENSIHIQTRELSAYDLENRVVSQGFGVRNTWLQDNPNNTPPPPSPPTITWGTSANEPAKEQAQTESKPVPKQTTGKYDAYKAYQAANAKEVTKSKTAYDLYLESIGQK